ncbi:MAG: DUF1775 domain-containing protein [Alphaproteobacteria bacterium]|jgi:uncharacterized protein YcnI
MKSIFSSTERMPPNRKPAARRLMIAGAVGVIATMLALSAQAHVTIWPRESFTGAMEKYSIRVPTEGDVTTTGAELEVPDGVVVEVLAVPNGWTYETTRSEGRIVAISWAMDIAPGEFAEFGFVARNPRDETTELVWTLRQLFADGTVRDWTMGPNGIRPTAVTTLSPRTR